MLPRLFRLLLCIFAALVAFAFLRAAAFVGKPFPGFLATANGVVTAFGAEDWSGMRAGLDPWDRIVEVDGRPVTSSGEVLARVRAEPPGNVFRYTVRRGGRSLVVPVSSRTFGVSDFLREPLPWLLTGTFAGAASLLLHVARPGWPSFGIAAFGVLLGVSLLRLDLLVGGRGAYLFQWVLPTVPAALLHLALVFPERPGFLRRRPALLAVPYAVSAVLTAARAATLFRAPAVWTRLDQLSFVYCALAGLILLWTFGHAARASAEPVARERARVVLGGLVPAFLFVGVAALLRVGLGARWAIPDLTLVAVWLWIASLAYACAKRNPFDFEIVVRRALTYTVLWAASIGIYATTLAVSVRLWSAVGYSTEALVPFFGVALALPFVPGLFGALRRHVEKRLFPLRIRLVEIVRELSEDLSTLQLSSDVCERVRTIFAERAQVSRVIVYVAEDGRFRASERGAPAIPAAVAGELSALGRAEAASAFVGPPRQQRLRDWMRENGFTLVLPLVSRSRLEGCLALGEPPNGRVFNAEDVDTVATLASRIAISLANAHAYDRVRDLENRWRAENLALREELEIHPGIPEIVGRSAPMQAVFRKIDQVAAVDTTVLLLGETGTGKELVARAIHVRSARRDGPLVKVSCAAIPAGLVESTLFGHERGAFTDASARRRGTFELAHRGTIFLDEIAELPMDVQAKLLRVLQEREFERVGGSETLRIDVRVIAATNRDLGTCVREGRFREDLLFRLNVFPIVLPPLRERLQDLPLLVDHFIRRLNERLGKAVAGLSETSASEIGRYPWPGNVRELENVLERSMVLTESDRLTLPRLERSDRSDGIPAPAPAGSLAETLRAAKIAAIDRALAVGGTQMRAAELLGLKPPSLSRMIRDLGGRR